MATDVKRVADWVGLRGEMTIAGLAQVALAAAVILALFNHRFALASWTLHVSNLFTPPLLALADLVAFALSIARVHRPPSLKRSGRHGLA
ncbi:MAG: hypothetical protein NZM04_01015 [Methylacidiphilales bacterium]|nr:hypothetical protein [Candidatus Methylacidiphilales bacterium]